MEKTPLNELKELLNFDDLLPIRQWLADRPDFFKNEPDAHYETLVMAVQNDDMDLAQCLIDYGADVRAKYNDMDNDLLRYTLILKKEKMAIYLIDQGIPIHAMINGGITPLMISCIYHVDEVTRHLIEKGVNINQSDSNGRTALTLAAQNCNLKAVQILVEAGADLEFKNQEGRNALEMVQKLDKEHPQKMWARVVHYLAPVYTALREKKELLAISTSIKSDSTEEVFDASRLSSEEVNRPEIRRL